MYALSIQEIHARFEFYSLLCWPAWLSPPILSSKITVLTLILRVEFINLFLSTILNLTLKYYTLYGNGKNNHLCHVSQVLDQWTSANLTPNYIGPIKYEIYLQ